jgi:3' terminal RNA ribose 2'-O-methyltransferase Hen1
VLLTVTCTHSPATDLGFLLHKNPTRLHTAELSFGKAHVFYPEANEERCTAALLVEVDPIGMVRDRRGPSGDGGRFDQYVNDRPYSANSFLSSAILEFYSTAMSGRSKERPDLAETALPLEAKLPVVACGGGEEMLRRFFEPLGYEVEVHPLPLDTQFAEWGESSYFALTLRGVLKVSELLNHLYVLIPVLDNEKHYWVDPTEIDKLIRRGGPWLTAHPSRIEIVRRYLRRDSHLTRDALARLTIADADPDPDRREADDAAAEQKVEKPISLHQVRLNAVHEVLKNAGARRVLDLGCGEGQLLQILMKDLSFTEVVGMDVSHAALHRADRKLKFDRQPPKLAERMRLIHGSLVYRDARVGGFDAAAVVEVIEHLDPPRLASFERVLFEFARPRVAVVTTPNQEYNALFPTLHAGEMRHLDHRFEWTRAEFEAWASRVAEKHGYRFSTFPLGPIDPVHGAPSQMAVFEIGAEVTA